MAIYSDFLFTPVNGVMTPWQNVWVRLVNNDSGTAYVSDTATPSGAGATGKFTFTTKPPGGSYTVYTGPTNTGAWTATGETGRVIGYGEGDHIVGSDFTANPVSPYVSAAPAGSISTAKDVIAQTLTVFPITANTPSALATTLEGLLGVAGGDIWAHPPSGGDDTANLTADIANIPAGYRLRLYPGFYSISSLAVAGKALTLQGASWTAKRDAFGNLGSAGYALNSNFGGTVIRCTATSGNAFSVTTSETNYVHLKDFLLIGPGSGTSTGLALGDGAHGIVNSLFENVGVMNFSVGLSPNFVEDSTFVNTQINGCSSGLVVTGTGTNQNMFINLQIQNSTVKGISVPANNALNDFHSGLLQVFSGTAGIEFGGAQNHVDGFWFESGTATDNIHVLSTATKCHLANVHLGSGGGAANNKVQIDGNGIWCEHFYFTTGVGIFNNTGIQNRMIAIDDACTYTDTGSATLFLSGTAASIFPGGLTFNGHATSIASGAPATSALGANVTSVTFTGNDRRGTIAIVMAGALARNTRIATCTFAVSYGAASPPIFFFNQTSGNLALVNLFKQAFATGVSFDIASDQALAAGTYTFGYIVEA